MAPAALCVAGVALDDIDLRVAWQAWRLLTSTFVLRGRRGAYDTGLDLVARLGAVSRPLCCGTLRGRGGTWRPQPSFCVAGVALMTRGWIWWHAWAPLVARRAAAPWRAWYLVTSTFGFAWQVWLLATSTFVLRGRCGT